MRKVTGASPAAWPAVPGWLPLLVGGLLIHAGLVREYLGVWCLPHDSVEYWLFDLTRHGNAAEVLLGVALMVPLTRTLGAVALGAFATGWLWVVLYLSFARGRDVSSIPLLGPCEMPFVGHLAVCAGLLAAAGWLLLGSPAGRSTRIPTATAVPVFAAAVFLLTALLKLVTTFFASGCLWVIQDEAGIMQPDPLYPWLWWGGRLAIPIEVAIGFLLLVPPTRRLGARAGGGFVVLAASGLVALTFITERDLTSMCGCFGPFQLPLAAHLSFDGALLGLLFWTHRLAGTVASETGERVGP